MTIREKGLDRIRTILAVSFHLETDYDVPASLRTALTVG